MLGVECGGFSRGEVEEGRVKGVGVLGHPVAVFYVVLASVSHDAYTDSNHGKLTVP